MSNQILQLISDEIICHKKAIEDIEEKLKLLVFLNSVDNYMATSFNLDKDELLTKRKELEGKLKGLIEQKSELTGNEKSGDGLKTGLVNKNTLLMSNYLSLHNYDDMQVDAILGSTE